MDGVVQITMKECPQVVYQGKVIERHDHWCKAIIITGQGNKIWECHDDYWHIEYGAKIGKINNK